jgi:AraC-like DNA-binding protein
VYSLYITSRTEDVSRVLRDELAVVASISANPREQLRSLNVKDMPENGQREYTLPGSLALQLVELVKRWKISPEELLSESGLSEESLEEPEARISVELMGQLADRARTLTGEPGLGYYMGLQKRASIYGFLGFGAMSASTLQEALDFAIRFTPLITNALELRLEVEGDVAVLVVEEKVDLGNARDFASPSLLVGLWQIANTLTGQKLAGTADVTMPRPDYFDRFAHLMPPIRFNQPVTRILFNAEVLTLPLVMPDRAALRLARQQCERELRALGYSDKVATRVRNLLPKPSGFSSVAEVSAALHCSPRTLKRRLAASGTSFSELLEEARRDRALLLLRSSDQSIKQIADQLGYSTLANFVRAFRRWTGQTPKTYRQPPFGA